MTWVFIGLSVLVVAGAVALALQSHNTKQRNRGQIPFYQRRGSLMSENQRRYYDALLRVVGENSVVFPKVRVADLVNPPPSSPHSFRVHWQRVQRRSVDFLLCTPANLSPALAIRLETRVEQKRRLQAGPDVTDDVLEMARIPLLRVEVEEEYEPARVARDIRTALARGSADSYAVTNDAVSRSARSSELLRIAQERLPTFSRWSSVLWGLVSSNAKQLKV